MGEPAHIRRIDPALRWVAGQNLMDLPAYPEVGAAILLAALGHAFEIGDLNEYEPDDAELLLEIFGF